MNAAGIIFSSKCALIPLCLIGGYVLNNSATAVNQFATKTLGIPIDMLEGQEYPEYTKNLLDANRMLANHLNISLDRQLGALLYDFLGMAVREEIGYRFFLEKVVLPFFFPQLAVFLTVRICIVSLLFASGHLLNPGEPQVLAGQFLNTFLLGVVCSLSYEIFGLLGSICIHAGFNFYGWQYMYNQKLRDISKITAMELIDFVHRGKIIFFLYSFIFDYLTPFILVYKAGTNLSGAAKNCLAYTPRLSHPLPVS